MTLKRLGTTGLGTNSMPLPVAICNFIKMDGLGRVVTGVTNRASYSGTAVHAAMKFVTDGHSLREAEKKFGINYRTLHRHLKVKKAKRNFAVRHARKNSPCKLGRKFNRVC